MSISSVSSNHLYFPVQPVQADNNARSNAERQQNLVQLSDRAKQQLLSTQSQASQTNKSEEKEQKGKESVQVSSSIGRLSRITGLQREEVAALYRSIDKLT